MTKFVVFESEHRDVVGCTALESWEAAPALQLDVDDKLMKIVKEFEAETWGEAMQVYNDHYGYGKYRPMEEQWEISDALPVVAPTTQPQDTCSESSKE